MTHVVIRSKLTDASCQHNFHVGDLVTECAASETALYTAGLDVDAKLFVRDDGLPQLLEKEDYKLEETNV